MSNFSRRTFLQGAPAAAATSLIPVAVEAATELPVAKVNRIAEDLSAALADFHEGQFHAEVFPANQFYGGVKLVVTDLFTDESQEQKVRRMLTDLQREMAKLPLTETVGGGAHEITFDGGGYLRMGAKSTVSDDRLVMVGFVPPLQQKGSAK